jgi:hypothetical protein
MIQGFETQTAELDNYEKRVLLPIVIKGLQSHVGEKRAVKNARIVYALGCRQFGAYKIDEVRVRKLINHIRLNGLIPGLCATSKGYFIAENETELSKFIESLEGRENAIKAVRLALVKQHRELYKDAHKDPELFEKNQF